MIYATRRSTVSVGTGSFESRRGLFCLLPLPSKLSPEPARHPLHCSSSAAENQSVTSRTDFRLTIHEPCVRASGGKSTAASPLPPVPVRLPPAHAPRFLRPLANHVQQLTLRFACSRFPSASIPSRAPVRAVVAAPLLPPSSAAGISASLPHSRVLSPFAKRSTANVNLPGLVVPRLQLESSAAAVDARPGTPDAGSECHTDPAEWARPEPCRGRDGAPPEDRVAYQAREGVGGDMVADRCVPFSISPHSGLSEPPPERKLEREG